jgi:hypothetical protein
MIVEPPKRAVPAASGDAAPENAGGDSNGGLTFPAASHMLSMTTWTKTFTREPPKTKIQLREMLAEAVRNTQPETKRPPKAIAAKGDVAHSGVQEPSAENPPPFWFLPRE